MSHPVETTAKAIEGVAGVAGYAGPVALAAFAGVFLGGLALSMFWKWFGPWKALEEAKNQINTHESERKELTTRQIRLEAELAEAKAGLAMLREAMRGSGFALALVSPDKRR